MHKKILICLLYLLAAKAEAANIMQIHWPARGVNLFLPSYRFMSKPVRILFYTKKFKQYTSGPLPIYARITVTGECCEFSTGYQVLPEHWNQKNHRTSGGAAELKQLNKQLDAVKAKILKIQNNLDEQDLPFTAKELRDSFTGKKGKTLLAVFRQRMKEVEMLIGIDYTIATLKTYRTAYNHFGSFIREKFRSDDIPVREIDHAFIKDFEFYLKTKCRCGHNTTMKMIAILKVMVRICMANGWIRNNPFSMIRITMREVETVFLSEEELDKLRGLVLDQKRLDQVRDIYLFCCYTGLAYADVSKLAATHIHTGMDGNRWIYIRRTKTEAAARIPLLPAAEMILDKYKDHPAGNAGQLLLPVITNQQMNKALKEITSKAGIRKELTTHTARHTFATTVTLTNDVPLETVSKMLGHKTIKHTQHYARIVDKKISRDMMHLRSKFGAVEPIAG